MTLYRKSRRPFTEAEERMWHYLTEEARQVVPVDGPVYRIHIANDWIGEGPMSLVESLIEDGVLVEVGEVSTP